MESAVLSMRPAFEFTIAIVDNVEKIAAKRIRPNATIPYDRVKWWKFQLFSAISLDAMAACLRDLAERRSRMILRGRPLAGLDLQKRHLRRLYAQPGEPATLEPVARDWIVLDIDGATVPEELGDGSRLKEAATYVRDHLLPEEFIGARMIAAATASTGRKGPAVAHFRLYARLERSIDDECLRRWAGGLRAQTHLPVDDAVLSPAQPIYTARPVFELGEVDPVPVDGRVVILDGDDELVALRVDRFEEVVKAVENRRGEAERAAGGDWRKLMEDTVGVGHDGALGDLPGTYFHPLTRGLGLAAKSADSEEEICAFVATILAERAGADRQWQYGPTFVSSTVRSFRGRDEKRTEAAEVGVGEREEAPPVDSSADCGASGEDDIVVDEPRGAAPRDDGPRLVWYGDSPLAPPAYLVADTVPETGVAILGGQYGFAKTFVGANLAAGVMIGSDFAGKPVNRRGGVLWLATEGEREIEGRIRAAVVARGGNAEERQPFARQARNVPLLRDKEALAELRGLAKEAAEHLRVHFGLDLAVIVVDTLSGAAEFDDENSAAETQKVMTVLTTLARETGALILVIDHHGKAADNGIRGSSAKSAAADAILACFGDRDQATGAVGNRRMAITKLRAGPTGRLIPFDLLQTEDSTTCVVQWRPEAVAAAPAAKKERKWPKALIIFKRALDEALDGSGKRMRPRADMPEVLGVDRERVRAEFFRLYVGDTPKAKKEAFLRSEKDAIERGIMFARNIGPELQQTVFWLATDGAPPP